MITDQLRRNADIGPRRDRTANSTLKRRDGAPACLPRAICGCCTGFRMPAVGELDACAWPASESRQGTNPRSGVHGDGALAMGIWLTRDSRDGGRAQL